MYCPLIIGEPLMIHTLPMEKKEQRGAFRSIGVNRTDFLSLIQMRPGMEKDCNILEWVAFASNAFNVLVPFYATIDTTPDYFSSTTREVTTDSFYWVSRMIGAMADASYKSSIFHIERYRGACNVKRPPADWQI